MVGRLEEGSTDRYTIYILGDPDFRWAIHEDKILTLEYSDTIAVPFDEGLQNLQGINHGIDLIIFDTDPRIKEFEKTCENHTSYGNMPN